MRTLRRAAALGAAAGFILVFAHTMGIRPWSPQPADAAPAKWTWALPRNFPAPRVPRNNPMTPAKVALGRSLFYEPRLSGNGTTSCGSCHMQSKAFTDGRARAVGATGELHPRSAQSLANTAYLPTLTWANPALTTFERQALIPIFGTDPVEMGVTDRNSAQVLARIRKDGRYRVLFGRAFPGQKNPVNWGNIIRAISAFERTIISTNSRYDRYLTGRASLSASERRGMQLFFGEVAECHHCHSGLNFADNQRYVGGPNEPLKFHNTGLYNVGGTGAFPEPNTGLHDVTGRARDMGRFRAPSLRNIAVTAPYMHDGSVATLRDVVDFYAAGGRNITSGPNAGDGRANPFKSSLTVGIDLSEQDRRDLVAFLGTLTDRSFLTNRRFSDPFRRIR